MKLLYIASIRLPTEKAHGIQIMKTCEALAKLGVDISLAAPNFFLFNPNSRDPFEYYGVKKAFPIKLFFSIRLIRLGPIGFFLETFIFFFGVLFSKEFWQADYIFTRDEMLASPSGLLGKRTIWETHTGSYNFFARLALKRANLIVAISQGLKDFYISKGVSPSKIVVAHDGVELEDFKISVSRDEVRKTLGLPIDKKIALYAGRLDGWKGVETFLEASKMFDDSVGAVVVGGDNNQVRSLSKKYSKVQFLGLKPYKDLPLYQKAADVLVIPNTSKDVVSKLYTSPLKVFSSMASGVPIVASDLPSIREVLNEHNSVLVTPDSPQALLTGVMKVLEEAPLADIMAKQALLDVSRYSWDERAQTIISAIISAIR